MASLHYVFLFIGLIAVSLRHVRAFTEEDIAAIKTGLRPVLAECGKEFGLEVEDIKKAKESGKIDTLEPCLFACIGKKIGLINDKLEFDTEKATEIVKKFVSNEDEQKKALEVVEECSSVNSEPAGDEKGCARAALLHKCFAEHKDQFVFSK